MKIALPLSLNLPSMGLRLSTVIERCRLVSRSEYLISAGIRKNSPNGSIHPNSLTKKFVAARKLTGINFSENPPPFQESNQQETAGYTGQEITTDGGSGTTS
ncbi:hypothetical protein BXA16_24110 [Salmonella enterica subsp. enterica serovar Typhimurium]|nr:hypothetical protein BXA16_24110 [Salmonella enterica subsp. enterica serovar Typhimurium]